MQKRRQAQIFVALLVTLLLSCTLFLRSNTGGRWLIDRSLNAVNGTLAGHLRYATLSQWEWSHVTLEELTLEDPSGASVIRIDALHIQPDWLSFFGDAPQVHRIEAQGGQIDLRLVGEHHDELSLLRALASTNDTSSTSNAALRVDRVSVSGIDIEGDLPQLPELALHDLTLQGQLVLGENTRVTIDEGAMIVAGPFPGQSAVESLRVRYEKADAHAEVEVSAIAQWNDNQVRVRFQRTNEEEASLDFEAVPPFLPREASDDAPPNTMVRGVFDPNSSLEGNAFFDLPFPSDMRRYADGRPRVQGFPNPDQVGIVRSMLAISEDRPGFPVIPVGYFRFDGPVASLDPEEVRDASAAAPIWIMDVDPASPQRGQRFPWIAQNFIQDNFTGANLIGVATLPGIVLRPNRRYAIVITSRLQDAWDRPLQAAPGFAELRDTLSEPESAIQTLYQDLWQTLDTQGIDRSQIVAATVFTTGDVVADTHALADEVLARESVQITALEIDPDDGADHENFCELRGRVSMPQFQTGLPPFSEGGLFERDANGLLRISRHQEVPVYLTLPNTPMPDNGYPLMVYFHGSGGLAPQVVDRGPAPEGGEATPGTGPAAMIARHGFAAVGAALPLSPDRVEGAGAYDYLNLENLAAMRDTFRQGIIEQRLLIEALTETEIDRALTAGCELDHLRNGNGPLRFDAERFVGIGQSMGGMYVNLVGAGERRLRALVPTGAGGFWSYFSLRTQRMPGVRPLVAALLRTDAAHLSHLHPAVHLTEIGWEAIEPMVYMPRLSRDPLPGIESRPIYQPIGKDDSYFPPAVFDAVTVAYEHPQAGAMVWPSLQTNLRQIGQGGIRAYPLQNNLTSLRGSRYTGAAVQSAGDGYSDPHHIFVQVAGIRRQWTCFFANFAQSGEAVIVSPNGRETVCLPAE